MEKSFLVRFFEEGTEAQKKALTRFKEGDYFGYLGFWIEAEYLKMLSGAVNGLDDSERKNENGQTITIVDLLRIHLRIGNDSRNKPFQSLKKLGKEEKIPEVEALISQFIDELSADFLAMSKKSAEIYHTLRNMGSMEKLKKNLGRNIDNPISPEDRLMMEDDTFMAIMNRRKSPQNVGNLVKQIQAVLN